MDELGVPVEERPDDHEDRRPISAATALLATLGYVVAAVTVRVEESDHLVELGADATCPGSDFSEPGKPLGRKQWAGAIDVAAGQVLANVCVGKW